MFLKQSGFKNQIFFFQWTGITQRTWHSLIDLVEKTGILKHIIPNIISTLNLNMESNKVNTSTVIDIITHLINIDKTGNK